MVGLPAGEVLRGLRRHLHTLSGQAAAVGGVEQQLSQEVLQLRDKFAPPRLGEAGHHGRAQFETPRPLFLEKQDGYWLGGRIQIERAPLRAVPQIRRPPRSTATLNKPPPPDIVLVYSKHLGGNDFSRPTLADPVCLAVVWLCGLFWVPFVRGLTNSLAKIRDATHRVAAGNSTRSSPRPAAMRSASSDVDQPHVAAAAKGSSMANSASSETSPTSCVRRSRGCRWPSGCSNNAPTRNKTAGRGRLEELQHMADMVNELLSFSKASIESREHRTGDHRARPVLARSGRAGDRPARCRHRARTLRWPRRGGDRQLLSRAIGNLLRNAMRHAGESEAISLDASQDGQGKINIIVRDFGPGVPEEDLPHLLDPFYRPDKANPRTRRHRPRLSDRQNLHRSLRRERLLPKCRSRVRSHADTRCTALRLI